MHHLRLLSVSAGLVGLAMAIPASAVPNFDSEPLFTAVAAPEATWSEQTSCGNLEWSQTFAWNGNTWRNATYLGRPNPTGVLANISAATPLSVALPNCAPVPDGGGSTAILLLGALLGLAGVGRRFTRASSLTA
jgi:MYXO-CTERM domain-containing protein